MTLNKVDCVFISVIFTTLSPAVKDVLTVSTLMFRATAETLWLVFIKQRVANRAGQRCGRRERFVLKPSSLRTSQTVLSDKPVCLLIRMPRSTSSRLRNQKRREGETALFSIPLLPAEVVCSRASRTPSCDLEPIQSWNHTWAWLSVTQQVHESRARS